MSDLGAAFSENLNRLSRFFTREGESGYVFAVASDERMIPEINQSLQGKARKHARTLSQLDLAPPQAAGLLSRLRLAAEGADGLVITGLSTWLNADPTHLQELNFSRESLQSLGLPLLFWIDATHLRSLSRQAADLYTQRRMATLFFERPLDLPAIEQRLQTRFDDTFKSSQDYERLQYRLALLQAQYQEASEATHPRLLTDYLLPLAEAYSDLDLHKEALHLLQPQLPALRQQKDPETLILLGDILLAAKQYAEAEESYLAARSLLEGRAFDRLFYLLRQLGHSNRMVGRLDQAEAYFQEGLALVNERRQKDNADESALYEQVNFLRDLGDTCGARGDKRQALDFYLQYNQLSEELSNKGPLSKAAKHELALSFERLGAVYQYEGKFDQARGYFQKYHDINQTLFQANPESEPLKQRLAISHGRLGDLYLDEGKLELALQSFKEMTALFEELFQVNAYAYEVSNGLAISYFKQGRLYRKMEQPESAQPYFKRTQKIWRQLHVQTGIPQLAGYLETVERDLAGLG